ncbi:TIGR01777 family oxidoreductase [Aeoliella sp. ICT_H6.2]|uniref:TIGR01777 family oxidoreductase n=1 Tax=Aeoliella straminimaris TaxID=2954799 RepID=A0A9X2F8V0_9BACT|nr:TIGR01777 family oxidoreductase [Aeoliella straminimaris]MCO6043989.1 TIGR01777 family oxidoreductase [Aeoliella straminimaris]
MINHPSQVIAIGGASGLIGSALCTALELDGHTVKRLVRRPVKDPDREIYWKPSAGEIDTDALQGVDATVHLGGAGLAEHRWTDEYKQKIRESRVKSTRLLCETLAGFEKKPRVHVNASAIGYYGVRGDERIDETSPGGKGYLADVCRDWETATQPAWESGIRVCQIRIGVVLSSEGGALSKMLTPFRMGAGGTLGSGDQYMSWVALADVVSAIQFALDHDPLHGAVNATAPNPVTNREFTQTLGELLHRPTVMRTPAFAVRLMVGSEMADELLLGGARIYPTRLTGEGFEFACPDIRTALKAALAE